MISWFATLARSSAASASGIVDATPILAATRTHRPLGMVISITGPGHRELSGVSAARQRIATLLRVTDTETLTPTQAPERERTDDGDHDRFSHYAKKDAIARAYVTGEPIVALCGKKWVPSRDPSRYPICPTCKELKEAGWTLR